MESLVYRTGVLDAYPDVLTPAALGAIQALSPLNGERLRLMRERILRRELRLREGRRIAFLDPTVPVPRTSISVQQARDGRFEGAPVPADLERQWIQGTGPAARPRAALDQSLRNVAYALLSGADGWMFDGEDALGQVSTMSLENQRSLRVAFAREPAFLASLFPIAARWRWASKST